MLENLELMCVHGIIMYSMHELLLNIIMYEFIWDNVHS